MKKSTHKVAERFKIKERASRTSLMIVLAVFVFSILLAATGITSLCLYILAKVGILIDVNGELPLSTAILFMSLVSIVLGAIIAFFSSRIPLKPINNLINKMNRLAAGDFKARLHFGNVLSSHSAFNEISTSFNKMAEELENTELLRSDFINNFSHEFKTPIVSITGFASLLSKGNLSEEQKAVYIKSIEEESRRLADMATNMLNLTKVENQTILTDISSFNLSEQVRSALLLLEDKWTKKNIDLQLEFEEYTIEANEELLKQIWINLLDNAIKFSDNNGVVAINIGENVELLKVSISNAGKSIPPEKAEKIFNRFYQADESHTGEGNGIGLAIVKKIVTLHGGDVTVKSNVGLTVFEVVLPKKQS